VAEREMMTLPRPGPDSVLIAVVGEDGAQAWTIGPKEVLGASGVMGPLLEVLGDTQVRVREERTAGRGGEG
jgi:hypothetical protein